MCHLGGGNEVIIVVEIGVSKWWWGVWLFRAEAEKVWQGIKVSKEGRVPQGRFPRIEGSMDRRIDGSMDHFNFKSLKTNRSPQALSSMQLLGPTPNSPANLSNKQLFPTPLSPISKSLKR